MKTKAAALALSFALACPALAQFDVGSGMQSKPAWEQFKLPNRKVKLDFRNANADLVLALLSRTSGITIVKDPALKEPMTVSTPTQVSLKEAFAVVNAALGLRNFEMRKEGNLIVVKAKPQEGGRPDPAMMMAMAGGGETRNELRVYPIKHANASQVARVINEVFSQSQQSNNPMAMFGGGMVQFGGGGRRFGGGGAQGGRNGQTVRASSDDYSNTVIVNAPSRDHGQVADLIEQIDKPTEETNVSRVFKLQYALATEIAPVVQNVLTANAPKGRGGMGNQNIPIEQRFQQAFRFGSSQAAFGTVASDARTNSLVVSGTAENLALVEKVIQELDTEIKLETTTFVFPLDNARATDMAGLLQQAFGTRNGSSGFRNNQNNQNRNNQNNRQNVRFGGGGGGGFQGNANPDGIELDLAQDGIDNGDLQTNVGVQGFFFGGGGLGGQRQNTAPTQGRDAQGRLINVQDLTNQVTVIPDPNTNSLIVVTNPENAEIIRQMLGQLDKIPEQVMIETIIVEASLDSNTKLGVEWNFVQEKAFGTSGATGIVSSVMGLQGSNPQGFRYSLTSGNLSGFMNALQTDTRFQVLSTPRIFTSNNVEAQINISQRVPFVVSQREDANGNLTFTYDFEDVGIVLTVTPRITAGGYVTMDVEQTANDLQGFTSFNAPIVNQRQANTTVAVRDGETIILGGIMRTTVSATQKKIPLLGDIPILGNLFKTTDRTKQKTELLVFLTPRVVRNPDEAKKLMEDERSKLSKPSQDSLNGATKGGTSGGSGNDKKENDH